MASPTTVPPAIASMLWEAQVIKPDPGVTADLVNPPTQMGTTILVLTLELFFLTLTYLLRVYTKLFLNRKILCEDYFLTFGFALFIPQAAIGFLATKEGIGVPLWDLTLATFSQILHYANLVEILYGLTMLFTKLAILCQFRRFFVRDPRRQWVMSWTLKIFVALHTTFYAVHTILFLAGCNPREGFWNPLIPRSCIRVDALIMSSACINLVSDFAILFLPIFHVWNLKASRKQKLGLTCVFGVGALGCGASIARTYASARFLNDRDMSIDLYSMGIWASVEVSCAILASNTPYIAQIYQSLCLKAAACPRLAPKDVESTTTSRPSARPSANYSVDEPEVEKPRAIYLPPHTRSVNVDGELPLGLDLTESENYFAALFNPPTGPGAHTRRHELEAGLVPGTIVGAMRRQAERLEQPHRSRPKRDRPPSPVDDGRGWFA